MPIYQVTPLAANHGLLDSVISEKAAAGEIEQYTLAMSAGWMVAYKGTTVELSKLLSVTGQPPGEKSPVGATLIVAITSYYGRAATDLWEWLKTRFEASA
jgi:hypothetical protein